jgi:hypothetical protein
LVITPQILGVASLVIAVDVAASWGRAPLAHLGRVPISPALPLCLVLIAMTGVRSFGLARAHLVAWRPFLVVTGVALTLALFDYATIHGGLREGLGLMIAAVGEELVYRFAVLVVVGVMTASFLGRNWRSAEEWGVLPGAVGLTCAAIIFPLLPGHVAQMTKVSDAVPFACIAVLFGLPVLRTGAMIPAAIVHLLLNFATLTGRHDAVSVHARPLFAAAALIAMTLGTFVAGLQLGLFRRERNSAVGSGAQQFSSGPVFVPHAPQRVPRPRTRRPPRGPTATKDVCGA